MTSWSNLFLFRGGAACLTTILDVSQSVVSCRLTDGVLSFWNSPWSVILRMSWVSHLTIFKTCYYIYDFGRSEPS
ncbi:hypothetical protein BC826DRAFT_1004924 [Russula brevipes]|nr:hypothetical protein BC826DRAFT_1004924 [Russula brevipes]